MDSSDEPGLETQKDLGTDDKALVRRWLLELKLADKQEDEWRTDAAKLWKLYRSEERKRNSFPILWSNTETLRPAIYNSPPKPDVRRRFKDADPLGKAVSDVLGRSLEFSIDCEDFDGQIIMDVLDMLIPGRGLSRVKYIPTFGEDDEDQLEWEQSLIEHVQWDDFRRGPGKTWKQVTWEAFRHRLTREDLVERFGDVGEQIKLDNTGEEEINNLEDGDRIAQVFKTAEVWEIWDKDEKQVLFIAPSHKDSPLKIVSDPLGLQGFFPNPQPLYAIEDSQSLVPVTIYEQYKEQAEELNQISTRINKIVRACKVRGIYDATLSELSELLRGDDNDLIPAQSVAALFDRGGLQDAIWFMPVEQLAKVLQILYQQREASKQVIYEITGIADVLRGATNPNETLGAQELKAQFGSQRLKKLQFSVQKYIRGLVRIMAEVIAEKFQPESLKAMTGLNFPTDQQNQQAQLQYQQQAQLAQSQGQPPPPPQLPPSWEQIIAVLRDDAQRTFKIDIETDSTIAASIETDMQALNQLLSGLVQLMNGFGPAVQMGALPVEALKEMILAVTRRAKLGNAVEDALDKMQQPKPQGQDPSQAIRAEQNKMQDQMAIEKGKMEVSNQQSQLEADKKILDLERQVFEMQQGTAEKEMAMTHESNMGQQELRTEKSISQMQSMVEAIQNKIVRFQEQQKMEADADTAAVPQEEKESATVSELAAMNTQLLQSFNAMIDTLRARP